jgi:hypothetical protein
MWSIPGFRRLMPNHSISLLLSGKVDRFVLARILRCGPDDIIAWAIGRLPTPGRVAPLLTGWSQLAALGCRIDFGRMAKELAPLGADEAFAILDNWTVLADRVRAAQEGGVTRRDWTVWGNGTTLHLRADGPIRVTFPILAGGVLAADGWIVTAPAAIERGPLVMDASRAALGG